MRPTGFISLNNLRIIYSAAVGLLETTWIMQNAYYHVEGDDTMAKPTFSKTVVGKVVNDVANAQMNTFSTVGDLNNDGLPDIVISGRNGRMVWLENPGRPEGNWKQHLVAEVVGQECGGSLYDLTGNGYRDIINGGDGRNDSIFWWENPGRSDKPWTQRVIAKTGNRQFHDTIIGDVKNDGRTYLVFDNQQAPGGTVIYCVPIPQDPTISPWPGLEIIASGKSEPNPHHPWRTDGIQPEEGLAIGDVDGDGKNEVVNGTHWYKFTGAGWAGHKFATGYISTKCLVADVNGDGKNEIILSEGDPVIYGKTQGGKVSYFTPGKDVTAMWTEHVIDDGLLDAHSLQAADLFGSGALDLMVAEIGQCDRETDMYITRPPRVMIYENDGKGRFTRHIIDEGTGTHEALLVDMLNRGRLDIVGKPLHGPEKWNIHVWYNAAGTPRGK